MRQRFIQSFSTSGDVQTAIDGGQLGKPYVVYLEDEERIDWNTISPTGPEPEIDYTTMPLTIEILEGGESEFHLKYNSDDGGSAVSDLEFEINGDGYWEAIPSLKDGDPIAILGFNTGDIIRFRTAYERDGLGMNNLVLNLPFKVYGNIMSLLYHPNDFARATTFPTESSDNFLFMFNNCTGLTDASNLVLPATTLTSGCYSSMFGGCTSLTGVPELPATTLAEGCYSSMFDGCTSLTTAPVLPATTLADYCYISMFNNCTSLNYIKCLATDKSAYYCTQFWVAGVASTGTFVKAASMTGWTTNTSGIPEGWTVIDADI